MRLWVFDVALLYEQGGKSSELFSNLKKVGPFWEDLQATTTSDVKLRVVPVRQRKYQQLETVELCMMSWHTTTIPMYSKSPSIILSPSPSPTTVFLQTTCQSLLAHFTPSCMRHNHPQHPTLCNSAAKAFFSCLSWTCITRHAGWNSFGLSDSWYCLLL